MDAREKLNEFAELQGWDKNKLIGWSEAADFGEWLVKNCCIPAVVGRSEQYCDNADRHNRHILNDGFAYCPECGKEI